MKRILITGALGQIGSELTLKLRELYGTDNVLATDVKYKEREAATEGPFTCLDVLNGKQLLELAEKHRADTVIHLAALLSATAENQPEWAWKVNMGGVFNALETARQLKAQFFTPSSIGAFGPTTPKEQTPQETIQRPTTMYGINKLAGELLAEYYYLRYGVDTRGLRFPGLISYHIPPGGGTTDYMVEMYYDALQTGTYTSYLAKGTYLDMMYMPDALEAIIQLLEADGTKLRHRNAYNVSAMSVAPEEMASMIRKVLPAFTIQYKVDPIRQQIADSWPNSLDSSAAKDEWGFHPKYDLAMVTFDMLTKLKEKVKKN